MVLVRCRLGLGISIHALVKRATALQMMMERGHDISIHALVKRATQLLILAQCQMWISIHALVKRATKQLVQKVKKSKFQSTPS